jgi:hypothetical protein
MRFIFNICLVLAAAALLEGAAFAASFTASLDRDSITPGDSATLSLTFEGASPSSVPTPNVSGLQINQTGNSQNFSYVNGAMSSTVTVTFSVTSDRPGEYTIPALTADVGGQPLSTQPLKLTVAKASPPSAAAANSGNEIAFVKISLPKQKIYAGEATVLHMDFYLRTEVQLNNFQLTSTPADGFSAGSLAELPSQRRREQVGNHVFTIYPFALPLTAVKTGAFTLGPFTANVAIMVPNGFFGEPRQGTMATEAVNVEVRPLPQNNQPASFAGAIGNFTMTATAGPTTVTVGDPITVRVKVSGNGPLDSLTLPAQDAWKNFKTYPPTTKVEPADQFGFQGTKTFEQIISPLNTDVHELPPLYFSYFNPDDGQYHTLKSVALPLIVQAAGATPLPPLAAGKTTASDNQAPQDILPIKETLGALTPAVGPLVARPGFLAVQTVPLAAFIGAFVWRRRTDSLANNPRLRRRRAVALLIASGITDLKKYAAANQPDEFFATLFRLLQEQLGERLDCPASAITENVIEEHAVLRGAPKATLEGLRELFQLCNQARYAPVRGTSELNSVAAQFEKTIALLQEVKA